MNVEYDRPALRNGLYLDGRFKRAPRHRGLNWKERVFIGMLLLGAALTVTLAIALVVGVAWATVQILNRLFG